MTELLHVTVEDGVARVTLDDPDRRNILSGALVDALLTTVDDIEAGEKAAAIVLTGTGRAFCAGADLTDLLAAADGDLSGVRRVYESFGRVRRSPLLTIAAVNGPAVGAGLNLALACDVRVAADSAWFDPRFLAIGLHPGGGHLQMLQRLVGPQIATAMVLCGRRLDAAQAVAAGLAVAHTRDEDLLDTALDLAGPAAAADRELVLATKRSLLDTADLDVLDAAAVEEQRQAWSLALPSTAARLRAAAGRAAVTPSSRKVLP